MSFFYKLRGNGLWLDALSAAGCFEKNDFLNYPYITVSTQGAAVPMACQQSVEGAKVARQSQTLPSCLTAPVQVQTHTQSNRLYSHTIYSHQEHNVPCKKKQKKQKKKTPVWERIKRSSWSQNLLGNDNVLFLDW